MYLQFPNPSLTESFQVSVRVCENKYVRLSYSCIQCGKVLVEMTGSIQ